MPNKLAPRQHPATACAQVDGLPFVPQRTTIVMWSASVMTWAQLKYVTKTVQLLLTAEQHRLNLHAKVIQLTTTRDVRFEGFRCCWNSQIFWDMTVFRTINPYRCFETVCCLHLQGQIILPGSITCTNINRNNWRAGEDILYMHLANHMYQQCTINGTVSVSYLMGTGTWGGGELFPRR